MKRVLVTGGAGFIGSNLVARMLKERDHYEVVVLDSLSYSANLENLAPFEDDPRYSFIRADVGDDAAVTEAVKGCDGVLHLAAESHVDRSIMDPAPFVASNTVGTQRLLEAWRRGPGADGLPLVYVSTDEVYGSLSLDNPDERFTESSPLEPNSAYSASKAGGDLFARAYHHTFGLNVMTTRCSNNFGPFQFPEKVIPLFVTNLIEGEKVPLYGDGKNVRDWIHVDDHAEGIIATLEKGRPGEVYNLGADNERSNLELTHAILEILGHGEEMIKYVPDRLGHDRRYAIDSSKAASDLGWKAQWSAWPGALESTVAWYKDNEAWWRSVKSGAYRDYYAKQYGGR
ncbi:MAG: dTDP-glucose 4,6-dehydratase [Phycisphaerae bacterium]|nr:dTDP-glucose 4,6-dehydratase [Phycisphaerae bacterium]